MKVSVIRPDELRASEIAAWRAMQRSSRDLQNPFLSPGFTVAVARARPNTRLAVLEDGQETVGFFPFERGHLPIALPIAAGVSDTQGIVHVPGLEWDPAELLDGCKLDVWEFDHLLSAQIPWVQRAARRRTSAESGYVLRRKSPIVDVSHGFEAYLEEQRKRSMSFKKTMYKARKLGRNEGAVRCEFDTRDADALRLLLRWKSAQYRRTGRRDRFARPWIEQLVWDLFEAGSDGCKGTLSVLYAADRIAAAHFGLRSDLSLSCWFPAYDQDLAKYSPGLVLYLDMARAAARLGLDHLDLGKGDEEYKHSLATGNLTIGEGAVYRPSIAAIVHGVRRAPVHYGNDFVRNHERIRRVARSTLARVGQIRSGE